MIVCVSNLLTPDEIAHINTDLGQANFVPGQSTAGWHAKLVKQNEQAAKQLIVPNYEQLAQRSRELAEAIDAFVETPPTIA